VRTLTIAKRVVKQLVGDKRSLGLLFIAPVFVLFLLNIILNSTIDKANLVLLNSDNMPKQLIEAFEKEANIQLSEEKSDTLEQLKSREIDGVIEFKDNKIIINLEGSQTYVTAAVTKSVSTAISQFTKDNLESKPQLKQLGVKPLEKELNFLNGSEDMTSFDGIAPMMMGFFIFFFVFLLAGVSFLRERISGTLDRLLATPIKRMEIVLGYFFGFGLFVTLQTIVIQVFMVYGLKIEIKGNPFIVLLINILLAAGSLALGTLLSAFAKNEFQLFQFIPLIIVPQILFSGLFSLREAPIWVLMLSKIFPLTYGARALSSVVLRGEGLSVVVVDIIVLTGYAVLFIILNSLALKKYRSL